MPPFHFALVDCLVPTGTWRIGDFTLSWRSLNPDKGVLLPRNESSATPRSERVATIVMVTCLTAIAMISRILIAYNGGIWADEGSFLNAIAAPTYGEMIAYLKLHESHPPLFYILMRVWSFATGGGDTAMMLIPVILGAAIVPAMFVAGKTLFSTRVGLFAALISVTSATLAEHASQLRPYGLLQLLALASTVSLALGLTRNRWIDWIVYVLTSALMLYTHNWGWLILAGHCGAVAVWLALQRLRGRKGVVGRPLFSFGTVLLLYAPWAGALRYQINHAGHGSVPIEHVSDVLSFSLFGLYTVLETLVLGHLGNRRLVALVGMFAAIAAVSGLILFFRKRANRGGYLDKLDPILEEAGDRQKIVVAVTVFALLAGFMLSPLNNLLIARGIATVAPLFLLSLAYALDAIVANRASLVTSQLACVLVVYGVVASLFDISSLMRIERSNVREVAGFVRERMQPRDFLVVGPEWFAGSFDHYFPETIEQVDFPYDGRGTLVDFANVFESRQTSTAVPRLEVRLAAARRDGRRVWLVVDRRYLEAWSKEEVQRALRHRLPGVFSVRDIRRIRSTLERMYGPPRLTFDTPAPQPIHDHMIAYLFVPSASTIAP